MKVSVCLLSLLLFTVSTLAQPWITPGTRTNKLIGPVWITGYGLTVDGNVTTGTGTMSAAYFVGDGSLLTGVASAFNQRLTNAQSWTSLAFPSATGSSNYLYTLGDSLVISNAQNHKVVGAYGDTADAWFFYSPINLSGTMTATAFAGDGSALTGISGVGIPTLSGKGTGTVFRVGVFGMSNGTPGTVSYVDTSSNIVSSGIGLTTLSNLYGIGSYTGATMYVKQIFSSLNASNATASRLAAIGADTGVTNAGIVLSSGTNIYSVGDYTGATIRVKQIFSSLNASNATASRLAYIGADQGVTNTGVLVANGTNVSGVGSFQAAGSVTGANFFGANQGVGASLTLYETSQTHGVTFAVPNIVRSNLNIQFGSNGMRGNFSGIPVYTNLDSTGTNVEMAMRAISGATDDGITLTFFGFGSVSNNGGSGTNNKFATATISPSNASPSVLTATDANTNLVGTGIGLTTSSNLAGVGGLTMGGGLTNVGSGTNFIDSAQIGTNGTDLLFFGGVGRSNGLFSFIGNDLPHGRFTTADTNTSLPITYALSVSNQTANYAILSTEAGRLFSNKGLNSVITNDLPNNPTNGLHYMFCVETNKAYWIHGTNATIRSAASVSTNSGFIQSSTIGSTLHLVAISTNEWYAWTLLGTWTFQ